MTLLVQEGVSRLGHLSDLTKRDVQHMDLGRATKKRLERLLADLHSPDVLSKALEQMRATDDPGTVVTVMRQHVARVEVQEQGCAALRILAASHAENQTRIARAGGIEAVVKAMQTHAQSADVQQEGCRALRNSSFNHAENKARIADAGGIEAVVAAMQTHMQSAEVQRKGCRALRNLSNHFRFRV